MKQKPFTKAQERQLRANAEEASRTGCGSHHNPVVKFFCPWGAATWLITELHDDGLMFGLCDLGHGEAELGYVSLDELRSIRGPLGLTIERDLYFTARKTIGEYADEARGMGWIAA